MTKPSIAKAKRWAYRIPAARSRPDKGRCYRLMLRALYSSMSPKPDGTHPLDADSLKLEGE